MRDWPMASPTWVVFFRKSFVAPYFFHLHPPSSCFAHFCLGQSSYLDFSDLSWLFPIAQHPPQTSLTFRNVFNLNTLIFLVDLVGFVGFSLLWLSKGVHPHLRELFLGPTSIRSTFTSLRQPNLHAFSMLTKPVICVLAFHIHLVHGFSILEPVITFMVIRIIFFPYYYITFTHDYFR